jgi:hypothetical protein
MLNAHHHVLPHLCEYFSLHMAEPHPNLDGTRKRKPPRCFLDSEEVVTIKRAKPTFTASMPMTSQSSTSSSTVTKRTPSFQNNVKDAQAVSASPPCAPKDPGGGGDDNDDDPETIVVSDGDGTDDDMVEVVEDDDEELSEHWTLSLDDLQTEKVSDWLSKEWDAPVYVFFKPMPVVEYIGGHKAHVFECAARSCHAKTWFVH